MWHVFQRGSAKNGVQTASPTRHQQGRRHRQARAAAGLHGLGGVRPHGEQPALHFQSRRIGFTRVQHATGQIVINFR